MLKGVFYIRLGLAVGVDLKHVHLHAFFSFLSFSVLYRILLYRKGLESYKTQSPRQQDLLFPMENTAPETPRQ